MRFGGRGRPQGDRFDNRGPRENFRDEQPRFEPRFDPRKDGGGRGDRFEGRQEPRFDQRAPQGAPWERGDSRGAPRQDARSGGRWEERDNRARPAPRGAAGDKFAPRGPKQFGANSFKPHNAGGPAKRTAGAKVLKITRG